MSDLDVNFYDIRDGVYGDEDLRLICRMFVSRTTPDATPDGWTAMIDANLEDLGAPLIWRAYDGEYFDPKPPAAVVAQVEQEIRRQISLLLLRLEKLIQRARKKTPDDEFTQKGEWAMEEAMHRTLEEDAKQ